MPKLLTPRDELGEAVHTAMRKYWDTKLSSVVWNLTGEVCDNDNWAWGIVLDMIYKTAEKRRNYKSAALNLSTVRWSDEFRTIHFNNHREKKMSRIVVAWTCAIDMMEKSDWECITIALTWDAKE